LTVQDVERPASLKVGLWCNWIFVALTAVGWLGIAHFWLPARADLGLEATKVWFTETHHWAPDSSEIPASAPTAVPS